MKTEPYPLESGMWSVWKLGSNFPYSFWSAIALWILMFHNLLALMLLRLQIINKSRTLAPFWALNFKVGKMEGYFNCINISFIYPPSLENRTLIASGVLICPWNVMNMIWTIIRCIFFWQTPTMQMMLMGSFTMMSSFLWD